MCIQSLTLVNNVKDYELINRHNSIGIKSFGEKVQKQNDFRPKMNC